MTATEVRSTAPQRHRSPVPLLVAAVTATTVALGLVTGTGPLVGPLSAEFAVGTGAVSLMFSGALGAMLGAGVLTGPLAQRYGTRPLVLSAAALIPAGLLVAATAGSFPTACAGFALGVGGGAGCVFVPLLTAVGTAFHRHAGPAMVLATAGGGTGVIVAPLVSSALVGHAGLRTALVLLAAATAVVLAACAALAPPRPPGTPAAGPERRSAVRHLLRDRGFRRLYLGSVALSAAMFVPFVHLPAFAGATGLSTGAGAALVALSGLTSLAGRLVAAPVVARAGAWSVYRAAAGLLAAGLVLVTVTGGQVTLLVLSAVVFGVAHGAYVGVSPAVALQLYGPDELGLRLGALHTSAAAGGLLGPSAAGFAVDLAGAQAGMAVAAGLGVLGLAVLVTLRP